MAMGHTNQLFLRSQTYVAFSTLAKNKTALKPSLREHGHPEFGVQGPPHLYGTVPLRVTPLPRLGPICRKITPADLLLALGPALDPWRLTIGQWSTTK